MLRQLASLKTSLQESHEHTDQCSNTYDWTSQATNSAEYSIVLHEGRTRRFYPKLDVQVSVKNGGNQVGCCVGKCSCRRKSSVTPTETFGAKRRLVRTPTTTDRQDRRSQRVLSTYLKHSAISSTAGGSGAVRQPIRRCGSKRIQGPSTTLTVSHRSNGRLRRH